MGSIRDGLREVVMTAERMQITEEQLILALWSFGKSKRDGQCDGWGLSGFANHMQTFVDKTKGAAVVSIVCQGCKEVKRVPRDRITDFRHCTKCSGQFRMADDQAGIATREAYRAPRYADLPKLDDLEAVCNANIEKNPALARLALTQIEKGAFRGGEQQRKVYEHSNGQSLPF